MNLEVFGGVNWFNREVVRKVRNGISTKFWNDPWVGSIPLRDAFPRLYSLSSQKEAVVSDLWGMLEGGGEWRLVWRRDLFVWELGLVEDLLSSIGVFEEIGESDFWAWKLDEGGSYSVKSCYSLIERLEMSDMIIGQEEKRVLNYNWLSPAPLKVLAFSWTLLQDRIPTQVNLALRRVLGGGEEARLCVLCGRMEESASHLFLHCEVAVKVWTMVLKWVNLNFITPPNLVTHLDCWFHEVGANKVRKGLLLIWHATVWNIWLERNDRIFKGVNKDVDQIFDGIKSLSWCWCLNRLKIGAFMFFKWCWNPRDCLAR
jgi:hypothetical protein